MFNNYNKDDEINTEVSEFIEETYAYDSTDELKNCIMQTEIKNALKNANLKIYAFIYNLLVHFPVTDIQYETFTTDSFFINVHRLIKMKVHLHHSHITGKRLGYTQYYFIKGYVASACCSKELKIGGKNLTHKF